MKTYLHGRDLIGDLDFSKEEVETVLDVAFDLKRKRALNEPTPYLKDKALAMLFFFSSTRTRGSFAAGMTHLGGKADIIDSKQTQIAHGDTAAEIGEIYGRYYDGIAIRHCDWKVGNKYINEVAKYSRVPVLNMQCDIYHPFQCLADLMTIMEKKGKDLTKRKIVISWAYASSYQKPISVPQSLAIQMPRFCNDVWLAYPPEFKLMPEIMNMAEEEAKRFGSKLTVTHDMREAFKDADVVYPKSWGPLVTTEDADESKKIIDSYKDWITDDEKMALAKPDCIFMHPLPADRNIEVTDSVIMGPHSVVYDEAENRMHAQDAVMALTL